MAELRARQARDAELLSLDALERHSCATLECVTWPIAAAHTTDWASAPTAPSAHAQSRPAKQLTGPTNRQCTSYRLQVDANRRRLD